ncbi:MAG: glycoside hydrolase family 130 protein [Chthonomonadaceae bacterium]|nr:glycoside hydrolase family 130 protein [Chthonomonadaceae bacterium]
MSDMRLTGQPLPNIPWEAKPEGCVTPVWRHSNNPVVCRNATRTSNSVFNSAAVPFGDGFAGVFRCDDQRREMRLHTGRSRNGIDWLIDEEPIAWSCPEGVAAPDYGYDPRVCWMEDRYWVTWCSGFHGPCIGIGYTHDFSTYHMVENALLPFNRNGVLFPRRIRGIYMMLSRPSDNGHTPFGEIFLSQSDDVVHWGRHRWVMKAEQPWESTKIGAGPVPIETDEGWLLIYHGVLTSCSGFVYHWGVCLLDLEEPWKVLARCPKYLMSPQLPYEQVGDVPNVVFPCAALVDPPTGRMAVYYGGADTVTCLAFTTVDELARMLV